MGKFRLKQMLIFTPMLLSLLLLTECSPKLYSTGKDFVASGNYDDAIAQFTKLIEENPEYTEAYVARADAYEKAGKKEEAAADYKRATAFDEKDESIYYNAGRLYYELKQYEEAIPMLVKVTTLDKKHLNAYKYKMNSYIALEKYDQALKESNSLVDLADTPENLYWRGFINDKLNSYTNAETDLRKAIEKSPNMLEAYVLLGDVLLKAKKYDQSLAICTKALSIDSKCKEALWTRSKIYKEKIDYPSAINDLSKMIIFSPDDSEAFFARGIYYQEFNQHQSAINDFSKVISLDSKNALAYFHRAKSNEEITQYEKAIADYQTYAKMSDETDKEAKERLQTVKDRLYELNRESNKPVLSFTEPTEREGNSVNIVEDAVEVTLKGIIADESDIKYAKVDGKDVVFDENGKSNEFSVTLNVTGKDEVAVAVADIYNNVSAVTYKLNRTEINPPVVNLIAPFASSTGEIYLDVDNRKLYVEGRITDENKIKSIIVDEMTASYSVDAANPEFYATIDIANKNKFIVRAEDIYGNVTEQVFMINREGLEISAENPMGKTWVIFVENSNYETFASLEGPVKDVSMMKAALANYKVHNIIHKQNLSKADLERFFAIELRDLVRSNQVNSLLVWYAGHGKFINDVGYWVPVDAKRDDEFTYFNIST